MEISLPKWILHNINYITSKLRSKSILVNIFIILSNLFLLIQPSQSKSAKHCNSFVPHCTELSCQIFPQFSQLVISYLSQTLETLKWFFESLYLLTSPLPLLKSVLHHHWNVPSPPPHHHLHPLLSCLCCLSSHPLRQTLTPPPLTLHSL